MARATAPVAGDVHPANCAVIPTEPAAVASCTFCRRSPGRDWSDWATVRSAGGVVVVAPLGSLVAGYVLILPARHVASFVELDVAEYEATLDALADVVGTYGRAGYETFSVFEHGCRTGQPAAGCIDHAHWHVVPMDLAVPNGVHWRRVTGFDEVRRASPPFEDYLFLSNQDGSFVAEHVPGRQFLRQSLAAQVGRPDEWDYVVFPHLENVRATLDLFG